MNREERRKRAEERAITVSQHSLHDRIRIVRDRPGESKKELHRLFDRWIERYGEKHDWDFRVRPAKVTISKPPKKPVPLKKKPPKDDKKRKSKRNE